LEVIMAEFLPRPFGNPFGGFIGNELRYMGNVLSQGRLPYFAPNNTLGPRIGKIPLKDSTGESYRDAELRLAAAARAAAGPSAGGGLGGGNAASSLSTGFRPLGGTPQERAQAAEVSRIAQLTAQDPELQRYEKARAGAKTQQEMDAARDIGMQIWQQKYGNTPMGQPGGAVGIRNPLMDRTFGYQTGGAPDQQMGAPTLGPSPLVPQVDQSLNPASPNFIGGEGAPLMDFTRDEVTPELIAAYQKQLLEQAASGRK
jgi:hypothetical protein